MDTGSIIALLSLGFMVSSGFIVWLIRLEKTNFNNSQFSKSIERIESEVNEIKDDHKDMDGRVRNTEMSIAEIKISTQSIDRKQEAILTILTKRHEA